LGPLALRYRVGGNNLGLSPEERPIDTLIVESLELPSYRVGMPGR